MLTTALVWRSTQPNHNCQVTVLNRERGSKYGSEVPTHDGKLAVLPNLCSIRKEGICQLHRISYAPDLTQPARLRADATMLRSPRCLSVVTRSCQWSREASRIMIIRQNKSQRNRL